MNLGVNSGNKGLWFNTERAIIRNCSGLLWSVFKTIRCRFALRNQFDASHLWLFHSSPTARLWLEICSRKLQLSGNEEQSFSSQVLAFCWAVERRFIFPTIRGLVKLSFVRLLLMIWGIAQRFEVFAMGASPKSSRNTPWPLSLRL